MSELYKRLLLDQSIIENTFGSVYLQIKPGLVSIFHKDLPSNTKHQHQCHELCMVLSGTGFLSVNEETYPLEKGDIFIVNPDTTHEIFINQTEDNPFLEVLYVLVLIQINSLPQKTGEEEDTLLRFVQAHKTTCSMKAKLNAYVDFFLSYSKLKQRRLFVLQPFLKNMVLDCLASLTLSPRHRTMDLPINSKLDDALLYIAKNIFRKITLPELAEATNTSQRTLQHLFRQHLNQSVSAYISYHRMFVAANYLRMNYSVQLAAEKVGIQDSSQFSRVFKKEFGISPKQYQKKHSDERFYAAKVSAKLD